MKIATRSLQVYRRIVLWRDRLRRNDGNPLKRVFNFLCFLHNELKPLSFHHIDHLNDLIHFKDRFLSFILLKCVKLVPKFRDLGVLFFEKGGIGRTGMQQSLVVEVDVAAVLGDELLSHLVHCTIELLNLLKRSDLGLGWL